jgi:hypothetical protein
MKHVITFLKAPWPLGARVGDVIELDSVPAWALGKCSPAADDAEVTVPFAPALVVNVPPVVEVVTEGERVSSQEVAEAIAEAGDVIELDSSSDGAEFVKSTSRDEMEAEAKALGVEFRSNLSDGKLAERIAEAKAKQQ